MIYKFMNCNKVKTVTHNIWIRDNTHIANCP